MASRTRCRGRRAFTSAAANAGRLRLRALLLVVVAIPLCPASFCLPPCARLFVHSCLLLRLCCCRSVRVGQWPWGQQPRHPTVLVHPCSSSSRSRIVHASPSPPLQPPPRLIVTAHASAWPTAAAATDDDGCGYGGRRRRARDLWLAAAPAPPASYGLHAWGTAAAGVFGAAHGATGCAGIHGAATTPSIAAAAAGIWGATPFVSAPICPASSPTAFRSSA